MLQIKIILVADLKEIPTDRTVEVDWRDTQLDIDEIQSKSESRRALVVAKFGVSWTAREVTVAILHVVNQLKKAGYQVYLYEDHSDAKKPLPLHGLSSFGQRAGAVRIFMINAPQILQLVAKAIKKIYREAHIELVQSEQAALTWVRND